VINCLHRRTSVDRAQRADIPQEGDYLRGVQSRRQRTISQPGLGAGTLHYNNNNNNKFSTLTPITLGVHIFEPESLLF
jgi:hypothetical protein